jgi:hypothetical protein
VVLAACAAGTPFGRASQGDIAVCVFVRDTAPVFLKSRNQGGIIDDATDGELIGLALAASGTPKGSPQRNAVLARCREIGAF